MGQAVRVGDVIDERYTLMGVLGRGGMSTVYEARSHHDGTIVAVKLLAGTDESVQQQFFDELLVAARIRHPNVVEVHDFGWTDAGFPFITMTRLSGYTVGQYLRAHGPLPVLEAVPLFLHALEGLAAAHRVGIVHRDLKPSNLFICDDGQVVLLDFGLAQRTDDTRTQWGGTPRYSAPEALWGTPPLPSGDVYQAALVLAEMLSGKPLVPPTTLADCRQWHDRHRIELPYHIANGPFGAVLSRALSPFPAQRPADADALSAALLHALAEDDVSPTVRYASLDEALAEQEAFIVAMTPTPLARPVIHGPVTMRPGLVPGLNLLGGLVWVAVGAWLALTCAVAGAALLFWFN